MTTLITSTTLTSGYQLTADSTGTLTIQTGSGPTTAMYIDANQNVGFGTTSPTFFSSTFKVLEVKGTDTGVIQATGASTSVTVELLGGSSAGYVGTRTTHPLVLRTGDTERMRIDTSGTVTMTGQPAFYAYNPNSNIMNQGTVVWQNTRVNKRNGYNATTGIFTAPAAGTYLFQLYFRLNPVNAYIHPTFYYNSVNQGDGYGIQYSSGAANSYQSVVSFIMITMAVNDTMLVNLSGSNSASASIEVGQSKWLGFLIS